MIEKATEAKDEGTIGLTGAYIRELEKSSWMLDAWTKQTSEKLNKDMIVS